MTDITSTALKVLSQNMSQYEGFAKWARKAQKIDIGKGSVVAIPANKYNSSASTGTIETTDYTVIGPTEMETYVNNNSVPFISADLGTTDADLVYDMQLEPGVYSLHFVYVMECATTSSVVTVTASLVNTDVSPNKNMGSQEVEIDEANIPAVTQAGKLMIPHGYIHSGTTTANVRLTLNLSGVFSSSDCTQFSIIGYISMNRTEMFTDFEDIDTTYSSATTFAPQS